MPLAAFLKQVSDNTQLSAFEIIQSDLPDLQIADTSVKTIPAAEIFTRQELKVIYRVNNLGGQPIMTVFGRMQFTSVQAAILLYPKL